MIKFTEGSLVDLWPGEKTAEIQAMSYAVTQAMKRLKDKADSAMCYSNVDSLPEEILDYFAVEMRSMYYEQNLPIEQKREIVKATIKWYTFAGTPATVSDMVRVLFGKGGVVEWWDFDEDPFTKGTFDIVSSGRLTADIVAQLNAIIEKAKNVRSHLRRVVIEREAHSATCAVHRAVSVQECKALNYVTGEYEDERPIYAASKPLATEYGATAFNTLHGDASTDFSEYIADYANITSREVTAINAENVNTEAHSGTLNANIAEANVFNSFIKEENH